MMSLKNAQYNAVMRQYDLRQQQAIADQTERRNEIYAKLPAFAKIDSQIASFAADRARAAISGHPISKEALHEQLEQFNLEKARLLQSAGYPADYLDLSIIVLTAKIPVLLARKNAIALNRQLWI